MEMSETGSSGRNDSGFTFLELTIVLLLVGLFTSLLVMRVEGRFTGGDLAEASRLVIREINRFRGLAAYRHLDMTLAFDMDRNTLSAVDPGLNREDSFGGYGVEGSNQIRTLPLAKGVFLEDAVLEGKGKIQEGKAVLRFYANGSVDRALIHLRNEKDRFYTLEVNPLTGQVKIHDQYIDRRYTASE
jgi:prepilin-type N-terminal cleavage/methylation domain-containing protein